MKVSLSRPKEPSSSTIPKASGDKSQWIGHMEWFCLFAILFSGYLWYTSPAKTAAQSYFRLSLLTIGVVGYLAIQALKWSRSRNRA